MKKVLTIIFLVSIFFSMKPLLHSSSYGSSQISITSQLPDYIFVKETVEVNYSITYPVAPKRNTTIRGRFKVTGEKPGKDILFSATPITVRNYWDGKKAVEKRFTPVARITVVGLDNINIVGGREFLLGKPITFTATTTPPNYENAIRWQIIPGRILDINRVSGVGQGKTYQWTPRIGNYYIAVAYLSRTGMPYHIYKYEYKHIPFTVIQIVHNWKYSKTGDPDIERVDYAYTPAQIIREKEWTMNVSRNIDYNFNIIPNNFKNLIITGNGKLTLPVKWKIEMVSFSPSSGLIGLSKSFIDNLATLWAVSLKSIVQHLTISFFKGIIFETVADYYFESSALLSWGIAGVYINNKSFGEFGGSSTDGTFDIEELMAKVNRTHEYEFGETEYSNTQYTNRAKNIESNGKLMITNTSLAKTKIYYIEWDNPLYNYFTTTNFKH